MRRQNHLRIDPAVRLALDKGHQFGAGQSVMSRLENDILGTASGQEALNYSGSRKKVKSNARSLFFFWAVRELGYTQRDLARRQGMTPPAAGYAVDRGEKISKLHHYDLIN